MNQQQVTLDGTILSTIFQNEENGYTVLRLVTGDGEIVTVVGCIPCAAPGEDLILTGSWMVHPQHGEQFKAEEVERHMPTTETEILSYLSSGVIKGVGPATAQRLVDRFGTDTFRVLEEEPERLASIKGITVKKAREIGEGFRYQTGMRRLLEFLSLFKSETFHDLDDAVGTEQAHQVVFKRNIETRSAGIALARGTAAQLTVDPAGIVARTADHIESAKFGDPIPELDVGSAARHVGRDRDGELLPGACNDLGLFLMILRIEHIVRNLSSH